MEKQKQINIMNLFKSNNLTLLMVLILVVAVFSFLNRKYFSYENALNIFYAASIVGLLAIGETLLIIGGHIDLSSAAAAALCGVLVAILIKAGVFWPLSIVIVLMVGMVIGLFNSALVNIFKLQPFIATLATASVCEGFGYIICNGRSVGVSNQNFIFLGSGRIFGIPVPVIILIIFFIVFGFTLSRTIFGRSIYMIGGNVTAARLAGLNPGKISTQLYIISSVIGALAGIVLAARMHSGAPSAVHGAEFDGITAAVLGGVVFSGGTGTLGGCFIGLLIIQCFNNGLTVVGVSSFWQIVAKGLLLIAALILDYFRRTRLKAS
jgi:ribose transport system permease protein